MATAIMGTRFMMSNECAVTLSMSGKREPMPENNLKISLTPEVLGEGPEYERAAFGLLEIEASDRLLTALIGADNDQGKYQTGPYISGYYFAEWLTWNWWRLRWEPRPSVTGVPPLDWDLTHRMSDIGEGYVWPNITIACDGFQCELTSERSHDLNVPLCSYRGAPTVTVPAKDFEVAADAFVDFVLFRLNEAGLSRTNLQKVWQDLVVERNDPELARFRRIEALLGFDPDEADAERIESWIKDSDLLGENALDELATGAANSMLSAREIRDATGASGFDMNSDDAFRLQNPIKGMQWGQTAAWRIGAAVADNLRQQAGLADNPVTDMRLAELAGMSEEVLKSDRCTNNLSWVFHLEHSPSRVALRSKWKTSRRFDVARLIGDRLFSEREFTLNEPLSPATWSGSYRQKAQRRFAAELLSPWQSVRGMLDKDYSDENMEQVAEHFDVSPRTISTLVDNNEGYGGDRY